MGSYQAFIFELLVHKKILDECCLSLIIERSKDLAAPATSKAPAASLRVRIQPKSEPKKKEGDSNASQVRA